MGETHEKRLEVERQALALLAIHARRQLALPKNRAKGVPVESLAMLTDLAMDELREVHSARMAYAPPLDILAELRAIADAMEEP